MAVRMSEKNTAALKEALSAQQKLLQKLYNELDVEREASSTAASEALSMILRLQGEKAAMKMEAEQYKRLAEEKMCYAEESMEIFEDLVYQKEMEVAALDYQVQSYRYKLRSIGYNDPGVGEIKFPENLLQKSETLIGETSAQSISRRNSAPPVQLKFPHFKKGNFERERSESPETDLSTLKVVQKEHTGEEVNDKNLASEKHSDISAAENISSYWEQIRKLDERVKEIAGEQYANLRRGSRSPSQLSQVSTSMSYDAMKGTIRNEFDQLKHSQNLLENEVTTSSNCSPTVHDVFEVPRPSESLSGDEHHQSKDEGKLILEGDENCGKPNLLPNEAIKSYVKAQVESLNKTLQAKHGELNLCRPGDDVSVGCHLEIVHPTTNFSDSQAKFQLVNKTSEIVEIHRQALAQEPTNNKGEEELKLLNAIQEQLNSIQSEIKSLKSKKSSSLQDDLTMLSLMEAMVQFWL